ncbi:branched-chain amino acid ABC transporter permease [Candidatus Bipolaricaulota bacterium]|nr:branched-chain amino acid ABC transporter permease [Candidatus Bipolaricaulota bacterium]
MEFLQQLVFALVLGSSYALIAIGLTMVYGILKILHVAHAGIYTLGAYVGLLVVTHLTHNFWVALIAGMVASGLAGVLIYRGVYYYILRRSRIVPLIVSIGIFAAMNEFYRLVFGPYQHAFPAKLAFPMVITPYFVITPKQLLIIALTAVFLLVLYFVFNRTKVGLAWQACSQDLAMAGAVGVPVDRAVALNFLLGSALAGAAGILMAFYRNEVYPTMGNVVAYKAFVVVVLGGFGSIRGSVIAGLLLALVETFLGSLEWFEFPRDAIAFLLLIFVLMFRPKGLFGRL